MVTCEGDYIHWIADIFGECVVTTREQFSFGIGLLSTAIWMWAQLPQVYMNFKFKRVDGLSLQFLCLLVLGDVSNLTGCLITGGLVTQVITSSFFCCIDSFCTIQYIYYKWIYPRCCAKSLIDESMASISAANNSKNKSEFLPVLPGLATAALLSSSSTLKSDYPNPYSKEYLPGTIIGWCSGVIYSSSRIAQIIKNFRRKRTDGLSIQFFVSAWLGNCTYAISIFLKDSHWGYIWMQFPWLVGSMGPMLLDFIVLIQFFYYRENSKRAEMIYNEYNAIPEKDVDSDIIQQQIQKYN